MEKHNHYKLKNTENMVVEKSKTRGVADRSNKRGQLAIFVIIAIVIVFIILVVVFYPKIKLIVTGEEFTPQTYIRTCLGGDVKSAITLLNKQGGYANPEGFVVYNEEGNDEKVKFLCYTSEYYKTCTVQQPLIMSHYEQELSKIIEPKAKTCFANLKVEYEKRGYSVTGILKDVKTEVDLKGIKMTFESPLTITKESTERFSDVEVFLDSQMYNILSIVQSLVEFESTYGDSEITAFMQYYPNLKIEKIKMSDGTKIYKVSDVTTKEKFLFASRSLSWPPGYGVSS
jgi:hypothetical protein